ncbi:MAG: hypothetical protein ACRDV4_03425 [Acidimicrobiales bacterium]
MSSISSDEVRIPRHAREAVARHETVFVFNRERPVVALVHPDDAAKVDAPPARRLPSVIEALRALPPPDPAFVDDMDEVLRSEGTETEDPWERS